MPTLVRQRQHSGEARTASDHQISRPANWISRFSIEMDLIFQNDAVPKTALGLLNWGEFQTLKASARNWNMSRSEIRKFLAMARSVSNKCGPCNRLRPAVPYVYCAGTPKAAVLMHPLRRPLPQSAEGVLTRFGRYKPRALVFAVSVAMVTLNGSPLCRVTMPLS